MSDDCVNSGPMFGWPPGTVEFVRVRVDPIRRIGRYAIHLRRRNTWPVTYEFTVRALVASDEAMRWVDGLLRGW